MPEYELAMCFGAAIGHILPPREFLADICMRIFRVDKRALEGYDK